MTLRDKMLAIINDVNGDVAEREELVEAIAIALLTRKNLFILGEPGQAKSYAINAFRSRITDARQFERLLSKQSDEEQLFGRIDLSSLIPGSVPQSYLDEHKGYRHLRLDLQCLMDYVGEMPKTNDTFKKIEKATDELNTYVSGVAALYKREPTVLTTGKIPEADICFLDEVFKCNDGVLNSLLTALNERKYTNEGKTYTIPTISFFAASNEIPNFNDPQEKILAALYDRFELKVVTENISDRANRLQVLKNKQTGQAGGIHMTISLDELCAMQQEVAAVIVPDTANELADDVLCELRKNKVIVSDRKYLNYYPIAQAKAWLSGHTQVEATDLLALKNYLWYQPTDRAMVETTLQRMCINPMQDKVNDIRALANEVTDELAAAQDAGVDTKKAFRKFRSELLRVYGLYKDLETKAQNGSEEAMLYDLLDDLEKASRHAHEQSGYTYATLEELSALQ